MAATILIVLGLTLAVAGLAGLVWCIRIARKAQTGEIQGEALKDALVKISAVNMASMGGAMLGLAMLLVGLIID